MKILIVDDDPVNLRLLRMILEAEGHHTVASANGLEALEVLDREQVDAVISDILMPQMDGYRLCHEVRQAERFRHLPFIIYTATYTSPADEKLSMDFGADKYLRKPAPPKEILAAIREAVAAPHRHPSITMGKMEVLQEYSERLVSKLEDKNLELQQRTVELSAAHTQLRQMLEHSPAVLYTLIIEGERLVPVVVSDNIQRLLGFSVEESKSYDWWLGSLHPEDRERLLTVVDQGLKGDGYSTEYRIRHKDGTYRWIEDKNRVVRGAASE